MFNTISRLESIESRFGILIRQKKNLIVLNRYIVSKRKKREGCPGGKEVLQGVKKRVGDVGVEFK